LSDSLLCGISISKCNEGISSVGTGHGIHHKPQIPYFTAFFKKRNQFIFIHVFRYLPTKYLTTISWSWALPIWRRATVFSLSSGHIEWISGSLEYHL
ncbi:GSCOCG00003782001-RA-CDS, partial [Cotesia congregata]